MTQPGDEEDIVKALCQAIQAFIGDFMALCREYGLPMEYTPDQTTEPTQEAAMSALAQRAGIVSTNYAKTAASIAREAVHKEDYWRARDYLIQAVKEHEPMAWREEAIQECHMALERIERSEYYSGSRKETNVL